LTDVQILFVIGIAALAIFLGTYMNGSRITDVKEVLRAEFRAHSIHMHLRVDKTEAKIDRIDETLTQMSGDHDRPTQGLEQWPR